METTAEPPSEVIFNPFPKQQEFIDAVFDERYKFLLYGGSIRSGKTFVGISILLLLCKIFPGSRWAIVREDLPSIRRNVLPVFDKLRPTNFCSRVNKSEWTATCTNGSQIIFFTESSKDDPDLDRWKGLEVNGFLFEELDEVKEKTWNKAIERAGTWKIKGAEKQPPIKIIATCNPSQTWVKNTFYIPWSRKELKPPYFYLPALPTDNPHITEDQKSSWKELPEPEFRRFVLGSWDVDDAINQLISWATIEACERLLDIDSCSECEHPREKHHTEKYRRDLFLHCKEEECDCKQFKEKDRRKALGVDAARYGADNTVYVELEGGNVSGHESYEKTSIPNIANRTLMWMRDRTVDADRVGIDSVGLGAGAVDILWEQDLDVIDIVGGSSPIETEEEKFFTFKDLNAQMAWALKMDMENGKIGGIVDDRMKSDIASIRYFVDGEKKIKIESKEERKKRLGRSTDDFDALMYANWVRRDRVLCDVSYA